MALKVSDRKTKCFKYVRNLIKASVVEIQYYF